MSTIYVKERIINNGVPVCCSRRSDGSFYNCNRQSTLIKAKGNLLHKSCMKNRLEPYPGIVTDARWWDCSHTRRWMFEN
jgi:hypothetical protein